MNGDPLESCYYQQTPHVKSGCNYHKHKQTTCEFPFKYAQNLHKYDITVKWRSFTFVRFMTLQFNPQCLFINRLLILHSLASINKTKYFFYDLNWFLPIHFYSPSTHAEQTNCICLQHLVSKNLFACFTSFLSGLWLLKQMPWVEEYASDFNMCKLININCLPI